MQSGKLRHVITIQRRVAAKNPQTGEVVDSWESVPGRIRIRADVRPDRASEFFAAQQIQGTQNAQIAIRHMSGIDSTMRVVHHLTPTIDEYWDIEGSVHFQDRFRELRLMCLKRDAEGFRRGVDLVNP